MDIDRVRFATLDGVSVFGLGVKEMDDFWKAVTAIIGSAVAWVAWRQHHISKEQLKLALFEKRFAVFAGVRKFLTQILRTGNLKELEPLWEYRASIGDASFLFGKELDSYLWEIDTHALNLHRIIEEMTHRPRGAERSRLAEEESNELAWLTDQIGELKKRFSPYMAFFV